MRAPLWARGSRLQFWWLPAATRNHARGLPAAFNVLAGYEGKVAPAASGVQELADPLSGGELQVLRLVAAGLDARGKRGYHEPVDCLSSPGEITGVGTERPR